MLLACMPAKGRRWGTYRGRQAAHSEVSKISPTPRTILFSFIIQFLNQRCTRSTFSYRRECSYPLLLQEKPSLRYLHFKEEILFTRLRSWDLLSGTWMTKKQDRLIYLTVAIKRVSYLSFIFHCNTKCGKLLCWATVPAKIWQWPQRTEDVTSPPETANVPRWTDRLERLKVLLCIPFKDAVAVGLLLCTGWDVMKVTGRS